MDGPYLLQLTAIFFGIQQSLEKSVSNDCGTLRYDEPAVVGRNVTFYFEPTRFSTNPDETVEWCKPGVERWSPINDPRYHISNFSMVVRTTLEDNRKDILAKYGKCSSSVIKITLKVIDETTCGLWIKRSEEDVRLGETLELSYFPTSNIIGSNSSVYVQWFTVTNSTCPSGCDVKNVTGVYEIRHNHCNHEYVLSIVLQHDYNVAGRYRLQCTNRTKNVKYTPYITVTVPEMDETSCGLWTRRSEDVRLGETLEISYFPTSNIIGSQSSVYVQWFTVTNSTCPIGCDVTNVTGVYEIRHNPSNHEYVLSIVLQNDYNVEGLYRLQCTNRTTDVKYTPYISVIVPVEPNVPVLIDIQTLLDCDNCLVGTLGRRMQIQCRVSGGTKPLQVHIQLFNKNLTVCPGINSVYLAQEMVTEPMHMTEVKCSVVNLALDTPLYTNATIYVALPPQSLVFPNTEAKAGMLSTFPTCNSTGARPPSNVTLRVLGVDNGTDVIDHKSVQTENDRYTTTARVISMRKTWNNKDIECCVNHITNNTSECKTIKMVYKFPPESLRLGIGSNYTDLKPSYNYTVVCTISRANPACNATWELPDHVIKLDDKAETNYDSDGIDYTTTAYMHLNVSNKDNGKFITCIANCTDFDVATKFKEQHTISVPDTTITFNTSSPMLNLTVGDSIVIKCSAPWALVVQWSDIEGDAIVDVSNCGTATTCLHLNNVNKQHGGRYTCMAHDHLYNVSEHIDVTVQDTTITFNTSSPMLNLTVGDSIVIKCSAPWALVVQWSDIEGDAIVDVSNCGTATTCLHLNNVNKQHGGRYTCMAHDHLYNVSEHIDVTVQGVESEKGSQLDTGSRDGDTYLLIAIVLGCCVMLGVAIIVGVALRKRKSRRKSDMQVTTSRSTGEQQYISDGNMYQNSDSLGGGQSESRGSPDGEQEAAKRSDGAPRELVYADLDLEHPVASTSTNVRGRGTETEYVDIDFSKKSATHNMIGPKQGLSQGQTQGSGKGSGQGQGQGQGQRSNRTVHTADTHKELVYAELDLEGPRAGKGVGAGVGTGSEIRAGKEACGQLGTHGIIGAGAETEYVDIDFSKKAPPMDQPTASGPDENDSDHIYMNK